MKAPWWIFLVLVALQKAQADEVVMKDGSVYRGRVMSESFRTLLLTERSNNETPVFLQKDEIRSIIYEKMPALRGRARYPRLELELALRAAHFSSPILPLKTAGGLEFSVGARLHPLIQFDGFFGFEPHVSGKLILSVADAQRGYGTLDRRWLGFGGRIFPLGYTPWRYEPYGIAGYELPTLGAKGSGDELRGSGWFAGGGLVYRFSRSWSVDARLSYEKIRYSGVTFESSRGRLAEPARVNALVLTTGLAYAF